MSLYLLADQGKLPLHQHIDRETLEWIKSNKPVEFEGVDYSAVTDSINIEEISKLFPLETWFISRQTVNTIHGLRHLARVATYVYILAAEHLIPNQEKAEILIAASLHDIRRKDDKGDEGHAHRGADWFIDNKNMILGEFKIDESQIDVLIIHNLIKFHEVSNKELVENSFYSGHKILINILRAADALDRYIQPKRKWWINENYLNLVPNIKIKAFAFDFVTRSEEKHLNEVENKISVIETLKEIC